LLDTAKSIAELAKTGVPRTLGERANALKAPADAEGWAAALTNDAANTQTTAVEGINRAEGAAIRAFNNCRIDEALEKHTQARTQALGWALRSRDFVSEAENGAYCDGKTIPDPGGAIRSFGVEPSIILARPSSTPSIRRIAAQLSWSEIWTGPSGQRSVQSPTNAAKTPKFRDGSRRSTPFLTRRFKPATPVPLSTS